jgi:NAD-specific glutamate dehydrogenase
VVREEHIQDACDTFDWHVAQGAGRKRRNHRRNTGVPFRQGGKAKSSGRNFIRQYYSRVDPEDLAERKMSDLCGSALAFLDFLTEFKSGAARLRVYNPQREEDGWESTHTAVENVHDNMPFLLEAVSDIEIMDTLGPQCHARRRSSALRRIRH